MKGLIKPYRTGGGTRRYSQEDIDKLIQIQNLSQRGINLDGIKIIYEMKDKIEELQNKILLLENEISNQKIDSKNKEKEIHKSYKNEIVKKSDKSIRR
jgi:DNA-binding transcriptional MerR regulator